MKTTFALCSAAIISFAISFHAGAGIIAGPIANPANGHDYYLLTPNNWTASEAEAENLGGTLAIIRNAEEQKWVFSTFSAYGDTNRNLWIGLHRQWPSGPLVWVTDDKVDYANWSAGNPDNAGGVENCVLMYNPKDLQPGKWNDFSDTGTMSDPICGVVEVPGKSNEKALTEKEKSLIGNWYNNGDPDQPCEIAATDHLLYAVDQNRGASRIIYTSDGLLFFPSWKQHAEIVKDKILWSRGNWWSRKPAEYKTGEISSDRNRQPPSGSMIEESEK